MKRSLVELYWTFVRLLPDLFAVSLRPSIEACTVRENRWLQTGAHTFPPWTQSAWLDLPGGIRTHHLVMVQDPERESMVLLHGTGSAASLAWSSSGDLATRYSLYAPDLPAFGRTSLPWEAFHARPLADIEDLYADWLASYVDALPVKAPVVVAHSIGAFFAVKFAKKYPTKLTKLVLVDPAGLLPTLGCWGVYFAWLFKLGIPTKQLRRLGVCPPAPTHKAGYWLHLHACPTAFGDQVVAQFITTRGLTAYWNRPALGDLLTAGVPFAFIYGETDTLVPPEQGRLVVEVAMRDASEDIVGLVPGAWHAPFHVHQGGPFVAKVLRAVAVARLPTPSAALLHAVATLDPAAYASTWSLTATAAAIARVYAHLRAASI